MESQPQNLELRNNPVNVHNYNTLYLYFEGLIFFYTVLYSTICKLTLAHIYLQHFFSLYTCT